MQKTAQNESIYLFYAKLKEMLEKEPLYPKYLDLIKEYKDIIDSFNE